MGNSYVFRVMDTFSPEEMEAFHFFLDSPYFNRGFHAAKHKTIFRVFEASRKQPDDLSKQQLYALLFPDNPIVRGKLERVLAEFKNLLHTFLLTQRNLQEKNEGEHALNLAIEMRERGLNDKYKSALERSREIANAADQESLNNYWLRFSVEQEKHEWDGINNNVKESFNLPEMIFTLDRYYFAYRLYLLNYFLLLQKMTVLPPASTRYLSQAWEIPKTELEASVLIRVSWELHAILKLDTPSVDDFERMRNLLQKHEAQISPTHLQEYHAYLRNLCACMVDEKSDLEMRKLLFQIQMEHLAKGYFYHEGKILPNPMLSITITAIYVQATPWANDFVERHKNLILDENETQDRYRLNKALCLFAEKNYDAALKIIPFNAASLYYYLFAHRLELKIYFEQDADLLPYKIDAFKMLIRRAGNKVISKQQYELNLHFINFVRQLSHFPKTKDPARSARLIRRIQAKKRVADRDWLLEKVRELGG